MGKNASKRLHGLDSQGDIPSNDIHQRIGTSAPAKPLKQCFDVEKIDAAARMSIATRMSMTMNDDAISAHPFLKQ